MVLVKEVQAKHLKRWTLRGMITTDVLQRAIPWTLLLLGGRRAAREADEAFQFGYTRERYFWSFIVSMVLFTLGSLFAIYEGIEKIRDPLVVLEVDPLVHRVHLALAGPGDNVVLTTPWYFNHQVWLEMQGIGIRTIAAAGGHPPP